MLLHTRQSILISFQLPTCTRHGHRQLPEAVLTQFVSPDDQHDVLETCRLKNINKYIEMNCASRWSFTENHYMMHDQQNIKFWVTTYLSWAWGGVVVKALRYKSEAPGIDSRCRRGFFLCHLTVPCALGSTQPLKMSTRIILGVRAAGA